MLPKANDKSKGQRAKAQIGNEHSTHERVALQTNVGGGVSACQYRCEWRDGKTLSVVDLQNRKTAEVERQVFCHSVTQITLAIRSRAAVLGFRCRPFTTCQLIGKRNETD